MNTSLRPARAIAPGRIILRELEARGWSQQDLAAILGRPEQMVSEIIQAKKQISAETARQLARAFGTSPELWMNLEAQYRLLLAEKGENEGEIERRSILYNFAPVNELIKRGWIHFSNSMDELEKEVCRFFQISSIGDRPQVLASYRVSAERGPEERAKIAWVCRVKQLAAAQPVKDYRPERMPEFILKLLAFTNQETDVSNVPELCIEYGIHFLFVPHLPKSYLDGAALWLEGHPVIALSLRYDRLDYFWFTVLHEIAHIYTQNQDVHLDQLFDLKEAQVEQDEIQANQLAIQWLLNEEDLREFIELNHPRYSRFAITSFGEKHNRHPGIIVGQLMYRGEMKYSTLREYLVKVRPYLQAWEDVSYPA